MNVSLAWEILSLSSAFSVRVKVCVSVSESALTGGMTSARAHTVDPEVC